MKKSASNIFRFLFVLYCFVALGVSLFLSGIDFSDFFPLMLLLIGIVFYIIASVGLQAAHIKEGRPLGDLVYAVLYPYMVYVLIFLSVDFKNIVYWMFPGYFHFLVITGGFILGIAFSPFMAARRDYSGEFVSGWKFIRGLGRPGVPILLMLVCVFIALSYFFLRFPLGLADLTVYQSAVFYIFLVTAVTLVIKFTYRHTIFNINRDPGLMKKYSKEN
jgi:hypothetical protein